MTVEELRTHLRGVPATSRVVFAVELAPVAAWLAGYDGEHGWDIGEVRLAGETVELWSRETEG